MSEELKEKIDIEEEDVEETADEKSWTEEFTVVGDELVQFVKNLVKETNVRRIVIMNEEKRVHFEVPLLFGLAGIAMLPAYAALALIAA